MLTFTENKVNIPLSILKQIIEVWPIGANAQAVFIPTTVLYTYPTNIDSLKRRRFSLTSPLVRNN